MTEADRRAFVYIAARTHNGRTRWGVEVHPIGRRVRLKVSKPTRQTQPQALLVATAGVLEGVSPGAQLEILCNDNYLTSGIENYLERWASNQWCKSDGNPIKNKELWLRVWNGTTKHKVVARRCKSELELQTLEALKARCPI